MDPQSQKKKYSRINDIIEKMILNVESRNDEYHQPFQQSSTNDQQSQPMKLLLNHELDQLSLFCTSTSTITSNSSSSANTATLSMTNDDQGVNHMNNWMDGVNLDSISDLCTILKNHVRNATKIDYISYARTSFDQSVDDNDNNYSASKILIDKWLEDNLVMISATSSTTCKGNLLSSSSKFILLSSLLNQGLQASSILLSILLMTPPIHRNKIFMIQGDDEDDDDDVITSIVKFIKFHMSKNVIPCISHSAHTIQYAPRGAKTCNSHHGDNSNDDQNVQLSSKKKRRKLSSSAAKAAESISKSSHNNNRSNKSYQKSLLNFLKKDVYKPFLSQTLGQLVILLEKLDLLIQQSTITSIDDQHLISICSTCLSTLTIDTSLSSAASASSADIDHLTLVIQSCGMNVISSIFRQYKQHRMIIVEDLFPLFLKLPKSKKSIRTFPVSNQMIKVMSNSNITEEECQHQYIQVMTALILFLIQSCTTLPIQKQWSSNDDDSNGGRIYDCEESNNASKTFSTTGLEQCQAICKTFTAFLISRCAKKGDDGGASEFRPILYNLIDDLLEVQLLPEFPAAEMLLMEICRVVTNVLLSNSSIVKENGGMLKNSEQTYLSTCMDSLGSICSDIASKIIMAKDHPLEFTKALSSDRLSCQDIVDNNPFTDVNEVNGCFCGREKSNVFSLDCDRCHRWFHGNCLRIAKDYTPAHWNCDECKMILLAKKQLELQFDDEKELDEDERVHIMRIVLLNYMTYELKRTGYAMSSKDARQFHIAKFVKDAEKVERELGVRPLVSFLQYLDMWNTSKETCNEGKVLHLSSETTHEYLSETGNRRLMIALNASKSELILSFPRLLGVLVALMGDKEVTHLRKGAIKAISNVVKSDPSLMSKKMLRDAVSERFNDDAISVREAVVNLVGVYVLQMPELATLFHNALVDKLSDNGISVRKRAIKIFRDIIITNPTYMGRTAVFTTMLQQAANRKEDDGVRDLIHETFQKLWFSVQGNGSAQIGPHETAKQMLDIVMINPKARDYLAALVREMLYGVSDGDKGKTETKRKQTDTQKHCSILVSHLFEELIKFEENRPFNDKAIAGPHLVALLSTLSVYAESSPSLLVKHIDTLLPYLKADNSVGRESEAAVVFHLCTILCQVPTYLSDGPLQELGKSDMPNDLMKITYMFDSKPTSAAIELLSKFSSRSSTPSNPFLLALMKLAKIFYKLLLSMKDEVTDFSKISAQQKSNIYRAMSVIGSICRHRGIKDCSAIDDIEVNLIIVKPSDLTWVNLPYSSYKLLEEYLDKEDVTTKCNALRAMGGIFLSYPRIMLALEQQGTLKELMSEKSHPDLQLETLKCFQAILCSEEHRVESGEARRQMQSKGNITLSKQVSGDQDGDATLIGSCCTQQLSRLFEMTSSGNAEIRENATRLIDTLSRQGLLNPMEAIPFLIALQGDLKQPQIRLLSTNLLKDIIEIRPDMVRRAFLEGIKQSFILQCKVYPEEEKVTSVIIRMCSDGKQVSDCIFKEIFEDIIGTSRVHTKKIIKSLLSLFSRHPQLGMKVEQRKRIPLLSFMTEILAYLPFNHLGDILFILHSISESMALEGNETMQNLVSFLQSSGVRDVDPDPMCVDVVEKAATKKNPSRSKALSSIGNKQFDNKKFAELCFNATSLSLLVRLYFYLFEAYKGISEKRLVEYDPNEKEKIHERGATRYSNLPAFQSDIPNSFTANGSINKDALIKQYAIFRSSIRRYDNSFTIIQNEETTETTNGNATDMTRKRKLSVLESVSDDIQ